MRSFSAAMCLSLSDS